MLIVAGDLHLGSSANLGRLVDQESSWKRLCVTACELGADVIGSGDWFHSRRPGPQEIDAFQAGLRILREGGRGLFTLVGNHEISTEDAATCLETACAGFDAIVFRGPHVIETEDGCVGFLPWAPPRTNAREASEALMVICESLAEQGARILIAHHALSGASLPTGLPILELAEPILDSHRLASLFEVTLSGHIHKRQVVVDEPLVAHIGVLARGGFGERNEQPGAWSVNRIGHDGVDGSFIEARPFDVPDRAFLTLGVDLQPGVDLTDVLLGAIALAEVEGAIVRMEWEQTSEQVVDTVALIAALTAAGAHRIDRLTPIVERVQSTRSAGVTEATDPRESFDTWLDGQPDLASPETMDAVRNTAHERIATGGTR